MDPDLLVICTAIVAVVIGVPIARAIAKRMERADLPKANSDVAQRLDALQQSVEAIAVEVERISEGQRFTTRLLAERSRPPEPPA